MTRVGVVDLGTNSTRLLVAEVENGTVSELERRRLASVERLGTVEEYVSEFQSRPRDQHDAKDTNESDEEELQR